MDHLDGITNLSSLDPLQNACFFLTIINPPLKKRGPNRVLLYIWVHIIIIPPLPEGGGGNTVYLCPSKKIFVSFFSVTVDGRNLIFGHKLHIGMPYCGKRFGPVIFLLPVCQLSWFLYTFNIYAHFSSHFSQQLLMAEIWYLVTSFI